MLGSAVEQSSALNTATAGLVLGPTNIPELLGAWKTQGLIPDLQGVRTCFAGITSGAQFHLSQAQVLGIQQFWSALVQAAGGRLTAYGPDLQGCSFLQGG